MQSQPTWISIQKQTWGYMGKILPTLKSDLCTIHDSLNPSLTNQTTNSCCEISYISNLLMPLMHLEKYLAQWGKVYFWG